MTEIDFSSQNAAPPSLVWVMVSGPYRSGAKTPSDLQANLDLLNDAATQIYRLGLLPLIGVNVALAISERNRQNGGTNDLVMPISLALCERCDACLRLGGASAGADAEVAIFRAQKKPVYFSVDELRHALERKEASFTQQNTPI